ncbi:L,D-transpeptidase [Achromobacter marplatensis]|uniref:L,D-transpeptidase n=1 Tax=Achromobacter marplatensis TaxID=470868 RepID=A0AA42WEB8_9BURK|nr:L,D-transpeptidase [Achromobacter marplatensis]EJO32393.1 signal peptide protein [Achromobacter marplatensis]MDH2052059.1 L,D-transpeptidase [Achromobacter marplatensis]
MTSRDPERRIAQARWTTRAMIVTTLACATPAFAQVAPDEVARAFRLEVSPALVLPGDEQERYANLALRTLQTAGIVLLGPQYVLVVDRHVNVQAAMLFWMPVGAPPRYVGAAPVSTGRVGQFDHFETPTGVFAHNLNNPDFRAEGTKNANGILGYGTKGMRVYDFGWQQARQGWTKEGVSTMRLQMHATDPYLLEPKLGSPQSKGCIRIPATLNQLIDRLGLLDADYELAADLVSTPWVLRRDRTPAYGAGRYLIVVETLRDTRPAWSPAPGAVKGKP